MYKWKELISKILTFQFFNPHQMSDDEMAKSDLKRPLF